MLSKILGDKSSGQLAVFFSGLALCTAVQAQEATSVAANPAETSDILSSVTIADDWNLNTQSPAQSAVAKIPLDLMNLRREALKIPGLRFGASEDKVRGKVTLDMDRNSETMHLQFNLPKNEGHAVLFDFSRLGEVMRYDTGSGTLSLRPRSRGLTVRYQLKF